MAIFLLTMSEAGVFQFHLKLCSCDVLVLPVLPCAAVVPELRKIAFLASFTSAEIKCGEEQRGENGEKTVQY